MWQTGNLLPPRDGEERDIDERPRDGDELPARMRALFLRASSHLASFTPLTAARATSATAAVVCPPPGLETKTRTETTFGNPLILLILLVLLVVVNDLKDNTN